MRYLGSSQNHWLGFVLKSRLDMKAFFIKVKQSLNLSLSLS